MVTLKDIESDVDDLLLYQNARNRFEYNVIDAFAIMLDGVAKALGCEKEDASLELFRIGRIAGRRIGHHALAVEDNKYAVGLRAKIRERIVDVELHIILSTVPGQSSDEHRAYSIVIDDRAPPSDQPKNLGPFELNEISLASEQACVAVTDAIARLVLGQVGKSIGAPNGPRLFRRTGMLGERGWG